MKSVLAFGDSVMKGVSFKNGRYYVNQYGFTGLLEERLGIQIRKKGQIGSTIDRLARMTERSAELLRTPIYDTRCTISPCSRLRLRQMCRCWT